MKKIIKLTESELIDLIKRVILEQEEAQPNQPDPSSQPTPPSQPDSQITGDTPVKKTENIVTTFFNDPEEKKPLPQATITSINYNAGQFTLNMTLSNGKKFSVYFDCASDSFYKPLQQSENQTSSKEQQTMGGSKVFMTKLKSNRIYHKKLMDILKNKYCTRSSGGAWIPKGGALD